MPTVALEVGVVLERRQARSPWLDVIWEAHGVLAEPPAAERGAALGGNLFYGGAATLEVHTTDTGYYRDNLESGAPQIWVVLRLAEGGGVASAMPEVAKATCDPNEGEGYAGAGWDIVNVVPMPASIAAALAAFVAENHVEQPFVKRKRDRADPEDLAAGARGPDRDRLLRERREREA